MTDATRPPAEDGQLGEPVRRHRERRERGLREGERSIQRNLAMIGVMGWLIVIPTLTGIFAGRWLDQTLDARIFWTSSLMFVGLVIGCWLAWRWAHRA